MKPCCLGLIILLSIPLLSLVVHLIRRKFFSTFTGRFIVWGIVLFIVTIVYHPLLKFVIGFNDAEKAGQFGDQYGALNCFLSGLAFIGLVLTIKLQQADLNLQREEMENTRKEFIKQTEQFKRQTDLLEQQIKEGRDSALKQLNQQKKTVWMQETLELISRLAEPVKSLRCTYGETSNTSRVAIGYEVVKLLYDAVTERIAYNYSIQAIQRLNPEIKPYLPRNISDTYFTKIDGLHNAIQAIRSVAYLHFIIIERIATSTYMNEMEKAELYMAVPLFGCSEYNLITYVYENSWKSLWASLAHNANKNLKEYNKHLIDNRIFNVNSLIDELSLNVHNFLLYTKLTTVRKITSDDDKTFEESLNSSNDEVTKAACEIFSYLCDNIETNVGKELCRQIATNELTALAKKDLSN